MSHGRNLREDSARQAADAVPLNETAPPVAEEDFYMDGPYLVFTAAYHRKRGYCCGSGCRHCPYDEDA